MLIPRLVLAAGLVACCTGCSCSPATITPPRVAEGGRALSIAVTSTDARRLFVATETGGLFQTFNGGQSWLHLGGLPNYLTVDVAVASLAPNTIIATARAAYRTVNDGGIWRSTDGGGSWSQPSGWAPPPGPGCPSRPSAYGLSHMPLSRTFYVGTDCGVSVSNDNGATWSHFVLDATATGVDSLQHRVRSLLVINRSVGVAAADRGVFHLGGNGVWSQSTIPASGGRLPVPHAFAAPWWSGSTSLFFHASGEDQKIWASTDGGATWSPVIPSPSVNNREAFVRIARSLSGDNNKFDVYIGDGEQFHRQTFSIAGFVASGNWTKLETDHPDPSDVAFDLDQRTPILLASDGGVHRTSDGGAHWRLTGGGYDGFNALQINEITGQSVSGSAPHLDLYYSTQDNDIRASPDGGRTWPRSAGGEGRHLRVDPRSVDHQGTRVTGGRNDSPKNFQADAHFVNVRAWPSAPLGNEPDGSEAPFLIVEDAYLQPAFDRESLPPIFNYYLTLSAGAAWARAFTLPQSPIGPAMFAGFLANPIVYQGVIRPGSVPPGGMRFGLMRVRNLATTREVARADSLGLGALGSLRTPIARYMVVGADPRHANHLIAPDLQDDQMKFSADGGTTWFPLTALTSAVTDTGRYLFHVSDQSLASVVAWDPYNACNVLVGTIQNGVIQSKDGGRTWARIEGTTPVTYISSFFFPPTGDVWISSNGRGLWRLDLDRQTETDPDRCPFPVPPPGGLTPDTVVIQPPIAGVPRPFHGLGDSSVCRGCSVIVVRDGWVTDFQVSGDTLRELAISGGTVSQVDRTGKELPLGVPNAYRAGDGRFRDRDVGRGGALGEYRRVRGLVVEGQQLRAVIAARDELSFAPTRTPTVFVHSVTKSGSTSTVHGDGMVRVAGARFLPPARSGQPVHILFDQEVVTQRVPVRADGTFSIELRVQRPRGEMVVTVEQRDGRRLTIARTLIDVRERQ